MKKFRTTAVLIPTLLFALTACGSSETTSDSAPDVTTTESTVVSEPVTVPVATANPSPAAPPVTNTPPPAPPVTTPASQKPKFNAFSVSASTACFPEVPDYAYPDVTVTWDISGATSVYIAIDNEFGPWETDLPAAGSMALPGPSCSGSQRDSQTYYVVAENASGRTVKQETRTLG